jgi:hypothetical protein
VVLTPRPPALRREELALQSLRVYQARQADLLSPLGLTGSLAKSYFGNKGPCRRPRGQFMQAGLAGMQVGLRPFTSLLVVDGVSEAGEDSYDLH